MHSVVHERFGATDGPQPETVLPMEFGYATQAGFVSSTAEVQGASDAQPGSDARDTAGLDRIFELLALSRVRIAMVALDFGDASPRLARLAAAAAAGTTGFLIALDSRRFVIVDVGPRGASPRDDQAIAERVRALAMASLSSRSDSRRPRLKSVELHLWSDQAGSAAQRLSELERLFAVEDRPAAPPRDVWRRVRSERFARVA